MRKGILISLLTLLLVSCNSNTNEINLAGDWGVRLDEKDLGISQGWYNQMPDETMPLPGTTDDAGLGVADTLKPALEKPQLLYLTRKNSYLGPAWYTKEVQVPTNWDGKMVTLLLERVIWHTQVWVDGTLVDGENESLVAPHRFDLTPYIKAGEKQVITIRVDNRRRYNISVDDRLLAHAYTNETQIVWNGVIGKIALLAQDQVKINNTRIDADYENKNLAVEIEIENATDAKQLAEITLLAKSKYGKATFKSTTESVEVEKGIQKIKLTYPMGDGVVAWDEFTPEVYTLNASLKGEGFQDENASDFGVRKLERKGSTLAINDRPLFLRGTLECAIFPLTGTPPMTHEGWNKVFNTAKEWGLNHIRFHSWCPPQAAFEVADSIGFYLQVELPIWSVAIKEDDENVEFIRQEADRMMREYGNHPSFCFWSMGNELQSNFDVLDELMMSIKNRDARHLYTTTSFTFEKGHGVWPEKNDDFFVTQWTKKGWVRGQGVFNDYAPSFNKDFSNAVAGMQVPLVTHEVGQYSVYPNMKEIEKYTGVLKPLNFISVREDLKKKGLLDKADSYTQASGRLAAILYKEEIERAMKTSGISGYQLLDLHDFPGQGTALVGLLDAFWGSKGVETPEHFSEFAAPVVPLVRYEKASYKSNEEFVAQVEISNYGNQEWDSKMMTWKLLDGDKLIAEDKIEAKNIKWGHNASIGEIKTSLSDIKEAAKLTLVLAVDGTTYKNSWNIWVYPSEVSVEWGKVKYTRDMAEAIKMLDAGETVLFNPDWRRMSGIEGKFLPVFWSPVHFPKQAGTMGLLCNPEHPALADFPTDMHTNWQWWDLIRNSTTLIMDEMPDVAPIVEQVDNFANNRRLASVVEARKCDGKLVLATFDLTTKLDERPAAKQLLYSLVNYMNSDKFAPKGEINVDALNKYIDVKEIDQNKESATSIY